MIFFIKKRNSKYLLMISILIVCVISLTLLINETRKNATVIYSNKNNNYTELYDQNNNETNFIFIGGFARSGTTLMVHIF